MIACSATSGRGVPKLLERAIALADRRAERIPTPELNRFVGEVVAAHPPPQKRGKRLRLYYAAQVGTRPPRIAIQVNDRRLITRDWAYHLENRLRERYGLEGVPLVIDFIPKARRARRGEARRIKRGREVARSPSACGAVRYAVGDVVFVDRPAARGAACARRCCRGPRSRSAAARRASGARSRWSPAAGWSRRSASRSRCWSLFSRSRSRTCPASSPAATAARPPTTPSELVPADALAYAARQPRSRDRPVRGRRRARRASCRCSAARSSTGPLALVPGPAARRSTSSADVAPVVRRRGGGRGPAPAIGAAPERVDLLEVGDAEGAARVRRGARRSARPRPTEYEGVELSVDRRDVATRAGRGLPRDRHRATACAP